MKRYKTISQKVLSLWIMILIIFCIIISSVVFIKFTTEIEQAFHKECMSKITDISNQVKELAKHHDYASIDDLIKDEVAGNNKLSYLYFSYGDIFSKTILYGDIRKKSNIELKQEIRINDKIIGYLKAQFNNSSIIKLKYRFLFETILGCLLFLTIFLIIIKKTITKLITNPINNLLNNIEEVAQGNLDVNLDYASNDEVGKLANSIKKLVADLREKDEYTSSILNATQAGVTLINAKTHIIEYVNPVTEELIGLPKKDIVGNICHKFICPAQQGECPISDMGLDIDNSEKILLTAEGKKLDILKTVKPIEIGDKKLLIETFIDISELKQLQDNIKKNEKKYRTMFRNSPAAIIMTDAYGIIVDINARVTDWLGYDYKSIIGKRILELPFITKSSRRKIFQQYKERAAGKDRSNYELDFIAKDGKKHIGSILVNALKDNEQNIIGEIITILDITEQKRSSELVIKNEKKFKELFDNSNDAIFIHTIDNEKILDVNEKACKITGYTKEELLQMSTFDLTTNSNIKPNTNFSLVQQEQLNAETTFRKKDGSIIWVDISARIIDRESNIAQGIVRDITEEKEIKEVIKNQGIKYSSMFNSVSDAIYILANKRFVDCNEAALHLFNVQSKKDFLKMNPKLISPKNQPDGSESFASSIEKLKVVLKQGTNKFEWLHKTIDGKEFLTDVIATKVVAGKDKFIHINVRDITRRKQAEREIEQSSAEIVRNNWLIKGQKNLSDIMQGDLETEELSRRITTFLAKYLNAQVGTLYLANDEKTELELSGSYAYPKTKISKFAFGEGLAGQAALENEIIILSDVPDNYISIKSALGTATPKHLIVSPFTLNGLVLGVIELASIKKFTDNELKFIQSAMDNIAIAINSSISRVKMRYLLSTTQKQSEQLQIQQEELRASNEELEEQTEELKASTEKLRYQQEELLSTNEELEEKTKSLEIQSKKIKRQNVNIEKARKEIEKKAEDLSIASKYKSEFLANMSHELRTPLNSLLILSRDLADNKAGNLEKRQVEAADIIYKSGNDLLNLINEILDLSKIEAGKMPINIDEFYLTDVRDNIFRNFRHQTDLKNIDLIVNISENIGESIVSDQQRVEQIIKNLISNSIKFTEEGSITIDMQKPDTAMDLSISGLIPDNSIAIAVTDTGIGIPKEKLSAIFNAFQQSDGTTSRKFGGTGLGLSISRELVKLLGGELQLTSEVGKGSIFTIILPLISHEIKQDGVIERRKLTERRHNKIVPQPENLPLKKQSLHINDDRHTLEKNDRKLLVIEDDFGFAKTLQIFSKNQHFKFIHAGDGETGIELAKEYIPDGIILDIKLPGMNGWEVLEVIKSNPEIRHIPVHMMSGIDEEFDPIQKGAIGYLTKPVDNTQLSLAFERLKSVSNRSIKNLLLVEDNENMRNAVSTFLSDEKIKITAVSSGSKAIKEIAKTKYDCMILDITLPDISGIEMLKKLKQDKKNKIPPVIIYTGKEMTEEEVFELNKYTNSIIIKGAKSEERLLDETALFLHQVVEEMPKEKQKIISSIYNKDQIFEGKRVLIVDDDMRNVFAVSHILEEKGLITKSAANGKKAIEILEQDDKFDLVLMDIMMPIMDGYEAMKQIRKQPIFKDLIIIALTAKAMKGDKEQCIEAGANDYLAKPLHVDKLLSMMRVWMYK